MQLFARYYQTPCQRSADGQRNISKKSHGDILIFSPVLMLALCIAISFQMSQQAQADPMRTPEILVLGDSQLSFGAGPVMLDFFNNIKSRCRGAIPSTSVFGEVGHMRSALIGARSTSLGSWLSKTGAARAKLCKKDAKWGVNASIWGTIRKLPQKSGTVHVQIGEGKQYQFCRRGQTPLEALFANGYYSPRLLVFNLLGNGVWRWAKSYKLAHSDVMRLDDQLPHGVPCLFMTTMPNYEKSRNKLRLKAQKNIEAAFATHKNRCAFVRGLTPQTIAAIQGKNRYFRRRKSGRVKDPFHPNSEATKKFYSLIRENLCQAIASALSRRTLSVNTTDDAGLATGTSAR